MPEQWEPTGFKWYLWGCEDILQARIKDRPNF